MKIILLAIIAIILAVPAAAQASLDVSAGAIVNNPTGTQDFYYSIGGKYRLDKFEVDLQVFGVPSKQNPKQPTRGTANVTFRFLEHGDWDFSIGAGGFKVGNEVGGFGLVGMRFKKFEGLARVGSQSFTEAEAFYPVFKSEHV